jgi:hypothetical protein
MQPCSATPRRPVRGRRHSPLARDAGQSLNRERLGPTPSAPDASERRHATIHRAAARHKERWVGFWRTRHEKLACETVRGRMILALEPGEWYAPSDVVALIGGKREHRAPSLAGYWPSVWWREPNPEYRAAERIAAG